MIACFQFKTMNILQHGQSVHNKYLLLLNELYNIKTPLHDFLPKIFKNESHCNWLKSKQLPIDIMQIYHWYHDCGKPDCLTVDENGKQHFPNHAAVSTEKFIIHSSHISNYKIIAELISKDMAFHTYSGDELINLCKHEYAASLYLTALAEVYSNAEMFGGYDSVSFKIKVKKLERAGNKLIALNTNIDLK